MHTMELVSNSKRKWVIIPQMDMLNERCRLEKAVNCTIPFIWYSGKAKQ